MKNNKPDYVKIINRLSKKKVRVRGVTFVPLWLHRLKGTLMANANEQSVIHTVKKLFENCNNFMSKADMQFEARLAVAKIDMAHKVSDPTKPEQTPAKTEADKRRAIEAAKVYAERKQMADAVNNAALDGQTALEIAAIIRDSLHSAAIARTKAAVHSYASGYTKKSGQALDIDAIAETVFSVLTADAAEEELLLPPAIN